MSGERRIVFIWEWGAGYGHLVRFQPIATRLMGMGCEVILIVKDLHRARRIYSDQSIPILHAPGLTAAVPRFKGPRSFVGLAWNLGVNERQQVTSTLDQWRNLLTAIKPSHVISDFGLLGAYVANSLSIPSARIGTGFGVPPHDSVLASMVDAQLDRSELAIASQMMQIVKLSAAACGLAVPETWAQLFAVSGPTLLGTIPEFDPYRRLRSEERYVGIWNDERGAKPHWKTSTSRRNTLAYLKTNAGLIKQCQALTRLGLNVLLVCDGETSQLSALKEIQHLTFSEQMINLDHCRDACSLIVCNANHGMTLKALSIGVPVALLPLYIEQRWNADVVEKLGLGVDLSICPIDTWQTRLEQLLESDVAKDRRVTFADALTKSTSGSLDRAFLLLHDWIFCSGTTHRSGTSG